MSDVGSSLAPPRRWKPLVRALVVSGLVVGALLAVLIPAVRRAREAARASQCLCNLCSIKMALLEYHDHYDRFPPAFVVDANGRRMHSWRILILPYLDASLAASYDLLEPWDGPNNRKLIDRRPALFDCPSRHAKAGLTSYVAIVGPGTAFPGATSTKLGDFHDGPSRTILVAEVSNVDIAWTEPRDLDARTMSWTIDDPSKPGLSSPHDAGPAVVFADASYRRLGTYHPPGAIQAMSTIDGGEHVDPPPKLDPPH